MVTNSGDEIANRAIELLKEVNTNLGPRLQSSLLEFHETYVSECLDRLRAHYDTVSALSHEDNGIKEDGGLVGSPATINKLKGEAVKMCRVMKVLQEYIGECDGDFALERKILPLHRYLIVSGGVCYSAYVLELSAEYPEVHRVEVKKQNVFSDSSYYYPLADGFL